MNGWILYKKRHEDVTASDYNVTRFLQEGVALGLNLRVITPAQCELIIGPDSSAKGRNSTQTHILIDNKLTPLPDFFIPRIGCVTDYFGLSLIRHMENGNVFTCNNSRGVDIVRDKLHIHQLLAHSGLPTPKTMLLKFPVDIELVKMEIGFPLVVKNICGTEGKGIYLCENPDKFRDVTDLIYSYNKSFNILVQEFVSYKRGEDVRAFVIGDKVVGCMKRMAANGGFKANVSQGASVEQLPMDTELERLALKTARLVGLEVAGIDLLFTENGYKVLEANSSPGFKGFEKATGLNTAKLILEYIKSRVKSLRN